MKSKGLNTLFVFILSTLLMVWFYSDVIFHLNEVVFANGGDGIKNYYTYLYHAKYDHSFTDFKGMNYPFYEHVVYTDGHPLLSYLIGLFGLANYGIGILNGLMLLSYPIGAIFIYLILDEYQVNRLWAILASVAIIFMSPQIFRLTGHLSLSYAFAIPFMWWVLIKSTTENGIKWKVFTLFYALFFFFTHPYLGLILVSFALAYFLVTAFIFRKNKQLVKQSLWAIFIQVLLPIIIFRGLVGLTDTHTNRIGQPDGFFYFHATPKSFLVAHHGPILYIKPWFGWTSGNWESWNYIGLTSMLFFIVISVYLIRHRKSIQWKNQFKTPLNRVFLASVLILLFALCIPFQFKPFNQLVQWFGPLKQFRVLGRFGWVFYFVLTTTLVIYINKIKLKSSKPIYYQLLFLFGMCLFFIEFKPTHETVSESISTAKNPFKIENINPNLKQVIDLVNDKKPEAIIALPFQHMSSENVMILGTEESNYNSFLLSFHTHTPLFNTISSRTSLDEAVSMINLFAPDFVPNTMAKSMAEKQASFLLIVTKNQALLKQQADKIKYGHLLLENDEFQVYDIYFDQWNDVTAQQKLKANYKAVDTDLSQGWKSDTLHPFYYDSFDDRIEKNAMTLPGAMAQQKQGFNKFAQITENEIPAGNYTLSFWYNIKLARPDPLAVVEVKSIDTLIWVDQKPLREPEYVLGDWALLKMEFSFEPTDTVNLIFNTQVNNEWIVVDELLIQPKESHFYKEIQHQGEAYLSYNNFWVKQSQLAN